MDPREFDPAWNGEVPADDEDDEFRTGEDVERWEATQAERQRVARQKALQLVVASVVRDPVQMDMAAEGVTDPDVAAELVSALVGLAQALAGLPAMNMAETVQWAREHLLDLAASPPST